MPEDPGQLSVSLKVDDDIGQLEYEELTAALQRELLQLDVSAVDRVPAGPVPAGARGVDLAALGELIVSIGQSAPVLGQVVEVIRAWASRSPKRTATLTLGGDTLELSGLSERDQRAVIRDWMARHAKPEPA
ncbi:MAG TPA: hypothetical protein VFV72_02960 [Candidatus Limnocylindrales bacterium]|nr:hypothetical protein [Candidatus Limnocylindrales bacterium]